MELGKQRVPRKHRESQPVRRKKTTKNQLNLKTMKTLTPEQLAKIAEPLPPESIAPHPTKDNLSTIKGIFVTERLNQVFGVGAWVVKTDLSSPITTVHTTTNAGRERIEYTAVAKTIFTVPA
ncbi:MAG: hypothetical protein EB101_12195, partial [Chitinophagia bacterium]|nr:hypothetical protein [Chitinophagia bacterium]